MIKAPVKKSRKSPKAFLILIISMLISALAISHFIFPKLDLFILKLTTLISFCGSMFFAFLAWYLDPGYLYKEKNFEFMKLLEEFEPNCLCPEC